VDPLLPKKLTNPSAIVWKILAEITLAPVILPELPPVVILLADKLPVTATNPLVASLLTVTIFDCPLLEIVTFALAAILPKATMGKLTRTEKEFVRLVERRESSRKSLPNSVRRLLNIR
jgi:hypothetical protein